MNFTRHTDMEIGDRIVVLEPIENGLIVLKSMERGTIIHLQNQVKATVWFSQLGHYASDPIAEALKLDVAYDKDARMMGLAVELKRKSFAIVHRWSPKFSALAIEEEKALTIPFFKKDENSPNRTKTNMSKNVGGGVMEPVYQYPLHHVIDVVEDGFADWVKVNTKSRRIRKREKENGDFPDGWETCLNDESSRLFDAKKKEVELAFAKASGVFVEFTGGLLIE